VVNCPTCGASGRHDVKDTRPTVEGGIVRRRVCGTCGSRFKTVEAVAQQDLAVQKDDGSVVRFSEESIRRGIRKAAILTSPASRFEGKLEQAVAAVTRAVRRRSSATVDSRTIGSLVLKELRRVDPATHIRFALVHLGRRDQQSHEGWSDVNDVRAWLLETYPDLQYYRPPKGLAEVVKKDGSRVSFDAKKLERSIGVASKGRGQSDADVQRFASDVARAVERSLGDQPLVTSGQIAAEILHALRKRDHVAFLRYASTAKGYVSAEDYEAECVPLRNL
jgi:transcriptional repressor NrdR